MNQIAPSPLDSLTPLQRAYVEARISGMSITAAARAAGAGATVGDKGSLEREPAVQHAIRLLNQEAMKQLALTRHDVLAGMLDAVKAASSSTELVAAWREIGKLIGAYEPQKIAVTHEMLLPEQLRAMTDRQLMVAAGLEGNVIDIDDFARVDFNE